MWFIIYSFFELWYFGGCSSAAPVCFLSCTPSPFGAVGSLWGGGCGRQGTSGMHPRGFHYLIFILMVKRILLLALISSRTAVGFVGIRSGSYVVGRSGERGHPAAAGQRASFVCVSLSPWIHRNGSQAVDLLPWIGEGTGNTNYLRVNSPVLGDHLTSCDRKPEGPNRYRYCCPTELTEVSGTGIYVVPNLPRCPAPVLISYRTDRLVRYRY